MALVVDTSFLIHIERGWMASGRQSLPALPADGAVATASLMELRIGLLRADTEERRKARLDFAEHVRQTLTVLSFGEPEARVAADIFVQLRQAGFAIGERDLMIAATAVANGHSLVTRNVAEFARVPGLAVLPDPLGPPPNP